VRETIRAAGRPVAPDAAPPSVEAYASVRRATEALCEPLSAEDMALQSMPDASPVKWHLAHTTWFFETFVLASQPGHRAFRPVFAELFNSYYRSVGAAFPRARRGLLSRPPLAEVLAYRSHVDREMQELLAAGVDRELAAVVTLGLHHEQQHQELILTDVKHLLACNPLRPAYRPELAPTTHAQDHTPARFVARPGGIVAIGHAGAGFAFDNEGPRHRRFLEPFALADRLVTNGEWQAFIDAGGYRRPELWLSDGFDAVEREGWQAPLYWERDGTGWLCFTLEGMRAVDPAEPVCHVSYYEADAFARWSRARLPGEDEWEAAAAETRVAGHFVASGRLRPAPAPGAEAPGALRQLFGDAWEWTRSAYAAYPGYAPPPGALGEYNGKFMSGQIVLRGGSCLTPQDHLRATYRNFFPPQARWQMSGLRLARDER
jgi:ergothioneine biosynthesis protein EgtB